MQDSDFTISPSPGYSSMLLPSQGRGMFMFRIYCRQGGHVIQKGVKIEPPSGKLGVLIPGLGAVSTTFIAGVEAIKKKIAQPVGSLTQLGTIRLGKRTERRVPKIHDFVPLASLDSLVFGGWDIYEDNCYESAVKAGVLDRGILEAVRPQIEKIKPWRAVFSQEYVKRLQGPNGKSGQKTMELSS